MQNNEQIDRILAIDPGTNESGYVMFNVDSNIPEKSGVLKNEDLLERIGILTTWISINRLAMAIEMVGHYGTGMSPGKTVFETCVWIGEFKNAWRPNRFQMIYRREVKINLCGSMQAKDTNVKQAIIDRFGGSDTAIGGIKCKICKGRGWIGRGRTKCTCCSGGGYSIPRGPLSEIKSHAWSALAIALTYTDIHIKKSA